MNHPASAGIASAQHVQGRRLSWLGIARQVPDHIFKARDRFTIAAGDDIAGGGGGAARIECGALRFSSICHFVRVELIRKEKLILLPDLLAR